MYKNPWDPYEPPPAPKIAAAFQANGLEERIVIPALKAVIVAVPAGLLVGVLIAAFKIKIPAGWAMLITFLLAFLSVFLATSSRGQWLIERLTGADLNLDGFIGEPAPPLPAPESIRVELLQDGGHRGDFIDLPYPEKLPALAAGLLAGRSFNQTAWTGHGALFSRSQFDQVRETMIERGLLAWKNPEAKAQGVELTAAGRAVMRRIAHPTPQSEDNR